MTYHRPWSPQQSYQETEDRNTNIPPSGYGYSLLSSGLKTKESPIIYNYIPSACDHFMPACMLKMHIILSVGVFVTTSYYSLLWCTVQLPGVPNSHTCNVHLAPVTPRRSNSLLWHQLGGTSVYTTVTVLDSFALHGRSYQEVLYVLQTTVSMPMDLVRNMT